MNKKTLSQLKKDIQIGDNILMTSFIGQNGENKLNDKINKIGFVSYKNTTGFYIKRIDDKSRRGSFCEWPKSRGLEYIDTVFKISDDFGVRTYQIIK